MAYKVFTNGSTLQASEINDNLMRQSVAVFSNAAARTAAITSPVEGQVTFLEDLNVLSIYDGTSWKNSLKPTGGILQVVSTTKTDAFSASVAAGAVTSVTGLTATITPSSTSSRILVIASVAISTTGDGAALILKRDSTNIFIGDSAGSRLRRSSGMIIAGNAYNVETVGITHFDNPATTSAITYGFDISSILAGATTTVMVNRTGTDADASSVPRLASSITLMEVAA